jgi:putative FmdB family regulatory protein
MPTYEYRCQACDHVFDEMQSFKDPPLRKCPACGKLKLRRAFGTGAAILFKGSGFYETDYRSESYKSAAKADAVKAEPAKADAGKNGESGNSDKGASNTNSGKSGNSSKSSE